jgi:bacterioferritin-associated ferredoxin
MKRTTNIDGAFVCHCARIRHTELLEIFEESSNPSYENFKRQYGIGGQCASCEYEVKAILDEYIGSRGGILEVPRHPLRQRILDRAAAVRRWMARLRPEKKKTKGKGKGKKNGPAKKTGPTINSRACMFFIQSPALQSSLVISNVNNPESNVNPNRGTVFFRVLVYDAAGELRKETGRLALRGNETRELFPADIFGEAPEDFLGSLYVEYFDLEATNTLRPYCVLNHYGADGRLRSRQHYHDKLYGGIIPGFVQCPSVLMPDRECWVAMVNCGTHDFTATFHLRLNGELKSVEQRFGPRAAAFRSITELFGVEVSAGTLDGHFWIESDRYVMTYFFWHARDTDVWIGQHH